LSAVCAIGGRAAGGTSWVWAEGRAAVLIPLVCWCFFSWRVGVLGLVNGRLGPTGNCAGVPQLCRGGLLGGSCKRLGTCTPTAPNPRLAGVSFRCPLSLLLALFSPGSLVLSGGVINAFSLARGVSAHVGRSLFVSEGRPPCTDNRAAFFFPPDIPRGGWTFPLAHRRLVIFAQRSP